MQKTLILFFLVIISGSAFSAPPQVSAQSIKVIPLRNDSTSFVLRGFDLQKIKNYSIQKDFHYDQELSIDTSWWNRFWGWFWGVINGALRNKVSGGFMLYLVIVVMAALVVFSVIKLIGLDLMVLVKKPKAVEVPYDELMENIHEINFNEEIDKAVINGNYRLSIRLLYLRSLKLLSDQELINWLPEKTNQAYIDELADLERKQQFTVLTLQFEYIWYGDFSIDKESFTALKGSFDRFNVKAL